MNGATQRGPFLLSGLRSAAYPEEHHPGALLYLPPAVDPTDLAVVVYLHGFENCIQNVIAASPGVCQPGGALNPAADLLGQVDRSGRNAALLVPEVRFYARSADPGGLGNPGALRALLDEVLGAMGTALKGAGAAQVRRLVVAAHSGAYRAAAALAVLGGAAVHELYLLDSFYGEEDLLDRFVFEGLAEFASGDRRYINLYGDSTAKRSQAQAQRIAGWLADAGLQRETLHHDDGADSAPESVPASMPEVLREEDLAHGIVCQRVFTQHSLIPMTHLGRLLATSGLPPAS